MSDTKMLNLNKLLFNNYCNMNNNNNSDQKMLYFKNSQKN